MADSNQDDWADALAKLAGGDVAPSEHEPAAPAEPQVSFSKPSAGRPASPRPASPSLRPAAPTPRPAPVPASPARDEFSVPAIEDQAVVLDDDALNIPAPDASVFAPRRRPVKTAKRINRAALYRTIEYRQTLIPILLTCGVLLIGFSTLRLILGPDSALANLPGWLPGVLAVTGVVLLAFAGLNMASVRQELAERAAIEAGKSPA